ncbi:MarR family winged helix-turn-helix transcriptional regulator [Brachybacterium saurashtrense]|uniref:MarR family transcriptional regulator n=1 Tax=Brachybacterium saurashtrense TaxID=556288 RepID=A0A345YLQ0_9MICO|nr:MarR family transcriptional regulator [Brachybacterium saurashtrense]AXK44852.1 MarR family transcriptional regulator [Brachybacterium saurashtrense]RRR20739.1 MarR family transcriptional regulator [Brachybacterium saurashtrense]
MTDLKRLYHDLVRFETELWAAVDARLRRDCDLQLTWFEIMQLLDHRPGLRVQDIATEFVITVGGTSKVVDRIEKAGYCRRKPNPHDRRSALLVLTSTGKEKLGLAAPVFEDELERRFGAVLGGAELDRMATGLKLLRAGAFGTEQLTA